MNPCSFCETPCDTVVRYFNIAGERLTRTACCARCLPKKVAVPLGFKSCVVKGRAKRARIRKERVRAAKSFEGASFAHDAAQAMLDTMISLLYS
jgi:hypothetical protein